VQFNSDARTDTVREKLRLLHAACESGRQEIALSLCESIKDTLSGERILRPVETATVLAAGASSPVASLPAPWADWARGWTHARALTLYETTGLERHEEPVELTAAFRDSEAGDLHREVRLARIDPRSGVLSELPFQLHGETRQGRERTCRLTFAAGVPAHSHASYLVFHGNPCAELPAYRTDLHVSGEGYGIEVANRHYRARLSRQMGQIERLASTREHGLELYAGGKGHGEPPTIDWGHDYVDAGGFQKLRMRNWAECPSFEVVKGPLFASVRRWGFPWSPLHPVFAPSRIHMDVTYRFYAGLPYFEKQSRFDVVQEVEVEAMRDDEWVFSGFSFTEALWIDRGGKLHEGKVPDEAAKDLWGVGFFHRESRDAFMALRLEHSAEKFRGLAHGGVPSLHYAGHGQLWSRYPIDGRTRLPAGAAFTQRNAYVFLAYGGEESGRELELLRHRLLNPLQAASDSPPQRVNATAAGALARPGETPEDAPLKGRIWDALRRVKDEQLYRAETSIVDLGYIYDVSVRAGTVRIVVSMPHRGRPVHQFLAARGGGRVTDGIEEEVRKVEGVHGVVVESTWDPPWTPARLSDGAREALGLGRE
jgi:metal-sulfur cluster biosynthetic enzyme